MIEMKPMVVGRADIGCTIDHEKNEIYVIGGHQNHIDSQLCEKFVIAENKWISLPILNEAKNSASVLIFNHKYLYVFGGEAGTLIDVDLTYQTGAIEMLDLYPA